MEVEERGERMGEGEGKLGGEGKRRSGTSLSIPAHRRRLKESEVGQLDWLLGGGWGQGGEWPASHPCAHSPRIVIGKAETSLGEAGLEQLQDLAWVPASSLPEGASRKRLPEKLPASSAVADVWASGQREGLGAFCPQRCKRTPPLSRVLCHFFRTSEKWEQMVVPFWGGDLN